MADRDAKTLILREAFTVDQAKAAALYEQTMDRATDRTLAAAGQRSDITTSGLLGAMAHLNELAESVRFPRGADGRFLADEAVGPAITARPLHGDVLHSRRGVSA
jgi:hypothetical protein